jgi:glycine cleavage system regulatory protein
MKDLTLTLIGPDKTGIVASLAQIATSLGGNWLDSRMMRLGGTFSGIVRISIPDSEVGTFSSEAVRFLTENDFQYSLVPTSPGDGSVSGGRVNLTLSGQDHPGIVHGIFSTFKEAGVNVEELSTGLQAAPWSGTPVFEARARLFVPDGISVDALLASLEAIAADLLVEVEISGSQDFQ